jgi:hypothetical protein
MNHLLNFVPCQGSIGIQLVVKDPFPGHDIDTCKDEALNTMCHSELEH